MKIPYFIIIGVIAGIAFALIDTIIGNAEISPVKPAASDLIKNLSVLKLVIYSAIGAFAGMVFYMLLKAIFKKKIM